MENESWTGDTAVKDRPLDQNAKRDPALNQAGNNDPMKQKPDASAWKQGNERDEFHPSILSSDKYKSSGKRVSDQNDNIVSVNPSSGNKTDDNKPEFRKISNPDRFLNFDTRHHFGMLYPFDELELGEGLFIPVGKGTTDALIDKLHRDIEIYRRQASDVEKDEKGDDIGESVIVHTRKRTPDGFIQLSDNNKPITGADSTLRPKYIYTSNFIVRPVIKGNKLVKDGEEAESDGALVIRVL
jgi:hypothetical protein